MSINLKLEKLYFQIQEYREKRDILKEHDSYGGEVKRENDRLIANASSRISTYLKMKKAWEEK